MSCKSPAPIRYATGQMELFETDLASAGFGMPWGHQRSYGNRNSASGAGINGAGWRVRQLGYLQFQNGLSGSRIGVVLGSSAVLWYQPDGSGGWEAVFTSRVRLSQNPVEREYCLTRTDGKRWVFHDNSSFIPSGLHGKLEAILDPFGHRYTATYDGAFRLESMAFTNADGGETSTYDYQYFQAGQNAGLLYSVILRVNGVPVREAQYEYYVSNDGFVSFGSPHDLKRVSIGEYDAASEGWRLISQRYYRYYTSGTVHGLKVVVDPQGCVRMAALGIDVETASDTEIAKYSAHTFEYDAQRRVTKETIRGGTEVYTFTYESNPAQPGLSAYNTWSTKTIETLPDGNRRTVYSNSAWMTMLSKLEDVSSGKKWYSYREFNADGRPTREVHPSGVASVSEPTIGNPALTVTLKPDSGLIYVNDYYSQTVPAEGSVATYQSGYRVREGTSGAVTQMRSTTYTTQTVGSVSIHPFASDTRYSAPGEANTTVYDFTYFDDGGQSGVFDPPSASVYSANEVINDTVVEQTETVYNEAGRVILGINFQRFHDATGTGPLHGPNDDQPKAIRSYIASWFDPIGRSVATGDYGTNGGAVLERPSTVPPRSDLVLVSGTRYGGTNGEASASIDAMGVMTRWVDDAAGRRIRLIEDAKPSPACCGSRSCSESNRCDEGARITEYAHTPDGQLARLTLLNPETGTQVTRFVYGTTTDHSEIARADLLRAKIYPAAEDEGSPLGDGYDNAYQRIEYTYNRQGQVLTMKDPNETVHAHVYDDLGRQIHDRITAFGAGIDSSVARISTAYNSRGLIETVTSLDHPAPGSGTILNQIVYAYDDFRQLAKDAQSHSGAVDGSTPAVSYLYANGAVGNTARRIAVVYPDGRRIDLSYGLVAGASDHQSRVESLKVNGETTAVAAYTFVGAARYVKITSPEPGIELTYIKTADEPDGDAGDPYTGYDRFRRSVDLHWQTTAESPVTLDRTQWGYDRNNNRTWRENLVAPSGQDEHYGYDSLSQVTDAARGNLNINRTGIGGIPTDEESFAYDPMGNWERYTIREDGAEVLDQSRIHNRDNQLVQIDGTNSGLLYDRAGQALKTRPGATGSWSDYFQLSWDGWGRLTMVYREYFDVIDVVGEYSYDGRSRRIVRSVGGAAPIHSYYNDLWRPVEERV